MPNWPEFVRQHGTVVYRTAWRILRHDQDAEDVTQAVMLEIFRKWPELGDAVPLGLPREYLSSVGLEGSMAQVLPGKRAQFGPANDVLFSHRV